MWYVRAHAQLWYTHSWMYHMGEITDTLLNMYRNCFILLIDPSRWKGSVSFGLGADFTLPHCLATGVWNLVPKVTSGPKRREVSFSTTFWWRVQRYYTQFLVFVLIYGHRVLWISCLRIIEVPPYSLGKWVCEYTKVINLYILITDIATNYYCQAISRCWAKKKRALWTTETNQQKHFRRETAHRLQNGTKMFNCALEKRNNEENTTRVALKWINLLPKTPKLGLSKKQLIGEMRLFLKVTKMTSLGN